MNFLSDYVNLNFFKKFKINNFKTLIAIIAFLLHIIIGITTDYINIHFFKPQDVYHLIFYKNLIAFLFYGFLRRFSLKGYSHILFFRSIIIFFAFFLTSLQMIEMNIQDVSIFYYSIPVFTSILVWIFKIEKFYWKKLIFPICLLFWIYPMYQYKLFSLGCILFSISDFIIKFEKNSDISLNIMITSFIQLLFVTPFVRELLNIKIIIMSILHLLNQFLYIFSVREISVPLSGCLRMNDLFLSEILTTKEKRNFSKIFLVIINYSLYYFNELI